MVSSFVKSTKDENERRRMKFSTLCCNSAEMGPRQKIGLIEASENKST